MSTAIAKAYEPRDVEAKWTSAWLENQCFAGRPGEGKEPYAIVIPPPNITGVLHMGHVLNNTLQDILIRRARLEGRATLWLPGTDHASIATHSVVERMLRREGRSRHDLGREKFVDLTWQWREKHGSIIIEQLKRLGCSCDWERTAFTMDPDYSQRVLHVFVELFRRGMIYRGKRMVNWCPATQTALSDEEVIMKPVNGAMYQVRYELVDEPGRFIEVKTTRPETIPGDVAIAVHPEDPRHAALVGKNVWRPLNRAPIPVIADRAVDREFGSGALKITPAHDKLDHEIGGRHRLPAVDVLHPDGTLNELAGPGLEGLDRVEGRKKAAELLRESGALVAEESYSNNVGYSERADVPIEPRLTEQWWLRYPKVEEAKAAVRDGVIRFYPERWSKVYLHWLENIQDWCISRQLWWGHRIPVWYRKGEDRADSQNWHVSVEGPEDPENWERDEDVLDTWASSWLWPFATLGWPDDEGMKRAGFDHFYPTTTLVTGPDIIFFWVARMIMAGLELVRPGEPLERRIPFKNVYFTGIIRDAQGRKMSKSLGNSPDPLDLIERFGSDGLRLGIILIAPQGQDIRFSEDRVQTGRNLCNKLWNACRFRQMSGEVSDNTRLVSILERIDPDRLDNDDLAILDGIIGLMKEVETALAKFEFNTAAQALHSFFWSDFCDWYVEVSKAKLRADKARPTCLAIQDLVLRQILLLMHPFAPFITEELWHSMGYGKEEDFIQNHRMESAGELTSELSSKGICLSPEAVEEVRGLKEFVSLARSLKAEHGVGNRKDVRFHLSALPGRMAVLTAHREKLMRLIGASAIGTEEIPESAPAMITPLGTLFLDLSGSIDVEAEKTRLGKDLEQIGKQIAGTEARLANQDFLKKAAPAVVEGARRQLENLRARKEEVIRLLSSL